MGKQPKNQIDQWLMKLERESWQLELLVSAFTIFLLIQATSAFSEFHDGLPYQYRLGDNLLIFIYLFLGLGVLAIKALTVFLIIHLLLRGFWIGAISLRSVQSNIDFSSLNYSAFFTKKLEKKLTSLDQLVIMLDEICSVIFSFSFLIISVLFSFGFYLLFLGGTSLLFVSINDFSPNWLGDTIKFLSGAIVIFILISGLIYLIDYFTLGFFKKFNLLSRIYYPIYKFYGYITLSVISKSIYYYLISKFSKRRIRWMYVIMIVIMLGNFFFDYDHYQYYPKGSHASIFESNYYQDMRSGEEYIERASIPTKIVDGAFLELFLRYNPDHNEDIRNNCRDYEPQKKDGVNPAFFFDVTSDGIYVHSQNFEEEDVEQLLGCLSSIFEVSVNDSLYQELDYYFFRHPEKSQAGLFTMIPTKEFLEGQNILKITKLTYNDSTETMVGEDYAHIPFWHTK